MQQLSKIVIFILHIYCLFVIIVLNISIFFLCHAFPYPHRNAVPVYTTFKAFATELSLALFMGLDPDENEALFKQVSGLATAHWHGKLVSLAYRYSCINILLCREMDSKDRVSVLASSITLKEVHRFLTMFHQKNIFCASEMIDRYQKWEHCRNVMLDITCTVYYVHFVCMTRFDLC